MLIDSHCHILSNEYEDVDKVIKNSLKIVDKIIINSYDLESSKEAVKLAKKYDNVYVAIGISPDNVDTVKENDINCIKLLSKEAKVVAIGEIGLDYHYDFSERENQKKWFRRQIQLANELKLPIIIHSREADEDTMTILKEEGAFSKERQSWFPPRKGPDGEMLSDSRVLIHCFSSSREIARQYVKLGATIGICGPVTYKNNRRGKEVVTEIPLEFLTVETDAPYLTPEPFRGRKNKAPYVEYTARKVAELKEMEYEKVAEITCENAKRFFSIP